MKKTLIALAVAGTAVAAGANASELYNQDGTSLTIGGRAEARMSVIDGDASDVSRVRVNILGKQQITDSLYGLGFYEAEYMTNDYDGNYASTNTTDDHDSIDTRYIYAGLGGSFGQVTYGKQDGALVALTNFTDIMDYNGGYASRELASAGDHIDNVLAYTGSFNNFTVNASYRFADRRDADASDPTRYDNDGLEGYAVSGLYNIGDTGLAFGLGFADQNGYMNSVEGTTNLDSGAQQYIATASFTKDALYVAAMYTTKDYEGTGADYDGYELAAQYTLDKTVFIATYDNGDTADNSEKVDSLGLEVAYKFKPNFKAYVDYNVNFLNGDDAAESVNGSEDEAVLGLRYDF